MCLLSERLSYAAGRLEGVAVALENKCASRGSIRPVFGQFRIEHGNADKLVMLQVVAGFELRNVDDLNLGP